MSSTTQPTDFSDLYTDLQNRVREQTSVSATQTIAKRAINIALQDMHIGYGEQLPWCERQAKLRTQADYTTGTVTITQGSTTLTGSSTAWNTNNAFSVANMRVGGKVVINGGDEVYEISAVGSDTSATISTAFIKDDVSAVNYVYFEDEYALASDFLRPMDWQNFDTNGDIEIIGRRDFRYRYPRNKLPGKPQVATLLDKPFDSSTTPVRKVRFWKPPDDYYLVPYAYVTSNLAVTSGGTEQSALSSDGDEPIVPLRYRHIIVERALYFIYRDRKDDQRANGVNASYVDMMLRMTGDTEVGAKRPQFRPRVGPYKSRAMSPYGRRGGRFVVGNAFDQMRLK